MTAAICAKESCPALKVCILEKKNQLGKKILATGNGKCNLSNRACPGVGKTLDFFRELGVLTRTDAQGRIYPYTEEARAVREALAQRAASLGVEAETSSEVISVEKKQDGNFSVRLGNKTLCARKVLIACGGKAGSAYGSTGDGFRFARNLGHTVQKPVPVLTAVEVKENLERLSGIRAKGSVRLDYKDETVFSEEGEIQFTKTGISGICVFNLSRFLLLPEGRKLEDGFDDYKVYIDFFPEWDDLEAVLEERKSAGLSESRLLQFLVRRPVAEMIQETTAGDTKQTAKLLKAFPLSPKGVKGWDFAQATKGGVCLEEINQDTMESLLVPGLYFAGEVLDYDGPCGGYNLQHAWETGMTAGKEMAK